MITDIALMIVVYGSARLVVAVLEPHRHRPGQAGQIATGLSWVIAVFAVLALAVLGVMVIQSGQSLADLTR
jgi:hypothetical protein